MRSRVAPVPGPACPPCVDAQPLEASKIESSPTKAESLMAPSPDGEGGSACRGHRVREPLEAEIGELGAGRGAGGRGAAGKLGVRGVRAGGRPSWPRSGSLARVG